MEVRLLIGIDDTDADGTHGTGFLARQLGEMISTYGLGRVNAISRHYLYPYDLEHMTHKNSAICLELFTPDRDEITTLCSNFVADESQGSAQPGVCINSWDNSVKKLISFGRNAKKNELDIKDAEKFARKHGIFLQGWNGGKGMIGAMAATGLRRGGGDGRFIWLERLRELHGIYTAEDLVALTAVDMILDVNGNVINPEDTITVGEWIRPINQDHQITIIVEQNDSPDCPWVAASKEYIYSISR